MTETVLRIHPAIGIARVGNSDEYYLAPETPAAMPQKGTGLLGGLPIKPGTESDPIDDGDLRDAQGALKRQAARFRIYAYLDAGAAGKYPYEGEVQEVTIGSQLDGGTVRAIVWMVHLANKKANCWWLEEEVDPPVGTRPETSSLAAYNAGQAPKLRNPDMGTDPADTTRLTKLIVDAGPRTIQGPNAPRVAVDASTTPSYFTAGGVVPLPDYPVSFPSDHFDRLNSPSGMVVSQLGALETDAHGRLIVLGGQGSATGWYQGDGQPYGLVDDVNNDGWFDDTADGPVQAMILFEDGPSRILESTAWIVSTDPAYAPQVRNVVSLWDEVYDTWLCCLGLDSSIYRGKCFPDDASGFQAGFQPYFDRDIAPMFRSAHTQMFSTGLNQTAIASHQRLAGLDASAQPAKWLNVPSFIRDPYQAGGQLESGAPRMPLALGDTEVSYLALTKTQYFFVNQWFEGKYRREPAPTLTAGESLDKVVLENCLGGRFSPGIDMTFIVRDTAFYDPNHANPSIGPFRPHAAELDYSQANKGQPFLGVGYFPQREDSRVEPGDICKFMAIPWHTDYNSCATHLPSPNPGGPVDEKTKNKVYDGRNTTLLWSWPAQRPVSVYTYADLKASGGKLPEQRFSVRGEGTQGQAGVDGSVFPMQQVGRFQVRADMVKRWQDIGTSIQGAAISGYDASYDQQYLLEVQGRLSDAGDEVEPYPNEVTDQVHPVGSSTPAPNPSPPSAPGPSAPAEPATRTPGGGGSLFDRLLALLRSFTTRRGRR